MEYPKFKVCVRCMTYNQSKYIEDALNGFTMQQTDFPFVCCVVDDASTDGEQAVIKKYMNKHFDYSPNSVSFDEETDYAYIHYAQHKENKNCYFAVLFLKENLYSKNEGYKKLEYIAEWRDGCEYEAMCEGDDYWIMPQKLQMQMDFMESHPEIGLCYTNFSIRYQDTGTMIEDVAHNLPQRYPMIFNSAEDFVLAKPYVCPPSWLYRRKIYQQFCKIKAICDGTFVIFSAVLKISKAYYIDEETSVYRVLNSSASHSNTIEGRLRREKNLLQEQLAIIDQLQLDPAIKKKCEISYYRDNLIFFAENHMKDELWQAKRNIATLSTKEKCIILIGNILVLSVLLKVVHKIHNLLKGY